MRFFIPTLTALTLLSLTTVYSAQAYDVQTHMQKAQAAAVARNWDGAIVELDAVVALDRTNIQAHTNRAMMLMQKQNYQDAIVEFSYVIKLDPKNVNAYKMRSELYKKTGETAKSQSDLITFMRLSPDDSAQLEAAAKAASAKGEWENAVNLWTLLSKVRPNDAEVLYGRGKALEDSFYVVFISASGKANYRKIMNKLHADIKASYDAAIKADPTFVPAYLAERDINVATQGLKLMPDNVDLLVLRADLSLGFMPTADEIKSALTDYNHALKIDPKSVSAYAGRAQAYAAAKKYDLALADTTRALELKPTGLAMLFAILELRGELYDEENDYIDEIAEDERALLLRPGDSDLLFSYYKALTHLPDKTRAFSAISKLIDSYPTIASYWRARAELYFTQKDYTHASADIDEALKLNPNNTDTMALRAKIVAAQ